MRRKVMTLTGLVTLTLWLGGSWGCASRGPSDGPSEARPTAGDRSAESAAGGEMADPLPTPDSSAIDAATPEAPDAADAPASPVAPDALQTTQATQAPDAPRSPDATQASDAPVTGATARGVLDRSAWEPIALSPVDGKVAHAPIYFRDCPIDADAASDRVHQPIPLWASRKILHDELELRMRAALSGDEARVCSRSNAAALVTQPAKMGFDTLALPVRVILRRPWQSTTTPE